MGIDGEDNKKVTFIVNYLTKGKFTGKVPSLHSSPDTLIVKSEHELIIGEDFFDKVQELVNQQKIIHRKYYKGVNNSKKHWLGGLVKCRICGHALVRLNPTTFICNGYCKGTCPTS